MSGRPISAEAQRLQDAIGEFIVALAAYRAKKRSKQMTYIAFKAEDTTVVAAWGDETESQVDDFVKWHLHGGVQRFPNAQVRT